MREDLATRIDRGNRRVVRQSHAERLDHGGHRRGRAHRHAMAARAVHAGFRLDEFFLRHGAGADLLGHLPYARARADFLAAKAAVQHRAARNGERRQIARRGAHQQRRRGFVAADQQDHAIDRIAANRLLDIHRRQIAEQHRGGTQIRFAQRHDRKFQRKAARFVHALFHIFGQFAEVGVARRQFRPRIADADHRPAIELIMWHALVFHPGAMNETILVVCRTSSASGVCACRLPMRLWGTG